MVLFVAPSKHDTDATTTVMESGPGTDSMVCGTARTHIDAATEGTTSSTDGTCSDWLAEAAKRAGFRAIAARKLESNTVRHPKQHSSQMTLRTILRNKSANEHLQRQQLRKKIRGQQESAQHARSHSSITTPKTVQEEESTRSSVERVHMLLPGKKCPTPLPEILFDTFAKEVDLLVEELDANADHNDKCTGKEAKSVAGTCVQETTGGHDDDKGHEDVGSGSGESGLVALGPLLLLFTTLLRSYIHLGLSWIPVECYMADGDLADFLGILSLLCLCATFLCSYIYLLPTSNSIIDQGIGGASGVATKQSVSRLKEPGWKKRARAKQQHARARWAWSAKYSKEKEFRNHVEKCLQEARNIEEHQSFLYADLVSALVPNLGYKRTVASGSSSGTGTSSGSPTEEECDHTEEDCDHTDDGDDTLTTFQIFIKDDLGNPTSHIGCQLFNNHLGNQKENRGLVLCPS